MGNGLLGYAAQIWVSMVCTLRSALGARTAQALSIAVNGWASCGTVVVCRTAVLMQRLRNALTSPDELNIQVMQ